MTTACNTVDWYRPTSEQLPAPTVELFLQYTGLETKDEAKEHIRDPRQSVEDPCIPLHRTIPLLELQHTPIPNLHAGTRPHTQGTGPTRPRLLFRTRPRKVAFDAGLSSATNLIGADIKGDFIQLGYELFRDEHSVGARFVTRNIFDEDFLADRHGSADMIYLGNFLHLFGFEEQRYCCSDWEASYS